MFQHDFCFCPCAMDGNGDVGDTWVFLSSAGRYALCALLSGIHKAI